MICCCHHAPLDVPTWLPVAIIGLNDLRDDK